MSLRSHCHRVVILAAVLAAAGGVVCSPATDAAGAPAAGAGAAGAPPDMFRTGFVEGPWPSAAIANTWMGRTAGLGAQVVLLAVDWAGIAPVQPAPGTAADPANPDYSWGPLDANVRAAAADGLTVALTVAGAAGGPAWADGPNRPPSAAPGTWKPNPAALGAFATALARRYSGTFNPGTGILPHVRYYQGWSEPNLPNHLTPQWVRVRGHWVAESPTIYRGLLNAFYAGVKSINRSDVVITGGTAPFGDPPGGQRVPPALFVRDLLCLNGRLVPQRCADPAHFDILAHHPYELGGPYQKAYDADDVSLPDLAKLTRPLAVAERTGRALPRGHKQVWVTEFSWDSKPPDPEAVPIATLARWIPETFYELWSEGVDTICWFLIEDQRPIPNYASTYQSGMYYDTGRLKPDWKAFQFPFLVLTRGSGHAVVWGITPVAGTVLVQRRVAGRWTTVISFRRRAHTIFTRTIGLASRLLMRAVVGGETSMSWQPS